LEIEREMLSADLDIQDVAVIGVEDEEWGQKVAAAVVLNSDKVRQYHYSSCRKSPKSNVFYLAES
jgi:acyl-CoA synthetase (AMP-forming)/AMP-acid ligase II